MFQGTNHSRSSAYVTRIQSGNPGVGKTLTAEPIEELSQEVDVFGMKWCGTRFSERHPHDSPQAGT